MKEPIKARFADMKPSMPLRVVLFIGLFALGCQRVQVTSDPPGALVVGYYGGSYHSFGDNMRTPTEWWPSLIFGGGVAVCWPDGVYSDARELTPPTTIFHFVKNNYVHIPRIEYKQGRPGIYDMASISRVAVLSFGNLEFTDRVAEALVHHSRWQVFDRVDLKKIVDEQDLQQTALVDQKTAVRVGKLAGVRLVVFGEYTDKRVVIKAVDVETGEYLVYKNIDLPASLPTHLRAGYALQYLIPYAMRLEDGRVVRMWWGGEADKMLPAQLEALSGN